MNSIVIPNAVILGEVSRMLSEGHSVVLMTKGGSMLPFIRGGKDSVELVRADSYGPYEIVLAEVTEGHYVLHRILSVEGSAVVLKGDGNLRGTETCRVDDIKGRVVKIISRKGKETDCLAAGFERRSRRWVHMPYLCRRVLIAIYRRIIGYEDNRRIQDA